MLITGIHHVQLAMPAGREEEARVFYSGLLEIPEVAKPSNLAVNGGVWFETGDLRVHLGVALTFQAATKAHVAFRVSDLSALASRLLTSNVKVIHDARLPNCNRFYASDPFGNRLEFLERKPEQK